MSEPLTETIVLGGESFTLVALGMNELVELEQQRLGGGIAELRYELWLSARRGGYQGAVEEIGALVEGEQVEEVRLVLDRLCAIVGVMEEELEVERETLSRVFPAQERGQDEGGGLEAADD